MTRRGRAASQWAAVGVAALALSGCGGSGSGGTIATTTRNALEAAGYGSPRVLAPVKGDDVLRVAVDQRRVATTAPDFFSSGSASTLAARGHAPTPTTAAKTSPVTWVPGGPEVPPQILARAGEVDAAAEVVWDNAPVRFSTLELLIAEFPRRQYPRSELVARFGKRPASLVELDPPSPPGTNWTARFVLLGVFAVTGALLVRRNLVRRRRRSKLLETRQVLLPPKLGEASP